MRQGGIGPDDYMFRVLPHGRWVYVWIRHAPIDGGREAYERDKEALSFILKRLSSRVCLGDLQRTLESKVPSQVDRNELTLGLSMPNFEAMCAEDFVRSVAPGRLSPAPRAKGVMRIIELLENELIELHEQGEHDRTIASALHFFQTEGFELAEWMRGAFGEAGKVAWSDVTMWSPVDGWWRK